MNYESVLQLNKYPTDRYNVLVPVTTMQAASDLQRIVVSEVQLDTRQDNTNRGPSKDIYQVWSRNGLMTLEEIRESEYRREDRKNGHWGGDHEKA